MLADHDFVNMVKCLDALAGLRSLQQGDMSWEAALDGLEDAIEGLDVANHHLLRGKYLRSCFSCSAHPLARLFIFIAAQAVWHSLAPFICPDKRQTVNERYMAMYW